VTFRPARRNATAVLAAIGLLPAACSGPGDDSSTTTTTTASTTISSTTVSSAAEREQTTIPAAASTSAGESAPSVSSIPSTAVDDGARPGVVAREGSVEDLLDDVPGADHFAELVSAWLAAVPGQEGVLRNARGITLFVPADDAFSAADRDALLDDLDATARFIGEHLVVSVLTLADLPGTVVTAMGTEHQTLGTTIDGHAFVVADIAATNGVMHVIDGPLVAPR
jgi:uncharacterized surface protein with fasciclin (FAS1) repeats